MISTRWMEPIMYFLVGTSSVLLALWFSSQFSGSVQSQEGQVPSAESVQQTETSPSQVDPGVQANDPASGVNQTSSVDPQPDSSVADSLTKEFPFLQPYSYDAENRRDPFRSFSFISPSKAGMTSFPVLPLQRYELDELKLIGIMWDVKAPKAMFLDPGKEVHTLGRDDRIGRNNGYIAVIREGEVVVVEAQRIRDELVYTSRVLKMER